MGSSTPSDLHILDIRVVFPAPIGPSIRTTLVDKSSIKYLPIIFKSVALKVYTILQMYC